MRRLAPILMAMSVLWVAAPAGARPDSARTHEQAADKQRREGQLAAAFAGYKQAWIAHPAPRYLYRLGQCEHLRGDDERALFFFQRYLDKKAVPPFKVKVERHVKEAHQKIAAARAERKFQRLAVLPVAPTEHVPALEAEQVTARVHSLIAQHRPKAVRGLDETYSDLHLASLVEVECEAKDDGCLRSLMPLLSVDAVVVTTLSDAVLTLRVVHADVAQSAREAEVLLSQAPAGIKRVLP